MKKRKGFAIGKFMPPHKGHLYLFDSALEQVSHLTVMAFWKPHEPIPGPLRVRWLREMRPDIEVLECSDVHPVDYDSPIIWDLWMESIRRIYKEKPDVVFASEDYGRELAKRFDADFVCVDKERKQIPISATLIRNNAPKYWDYIPGPARSYFVKKICILGGESTGKSTLAAELAARFHTVAVPEYAREFLENSGNVCTPPDMPFIADEQFRREEAVRSSANRFIFCDTGPLVTKIWSQHYFGRVAETVEQRVQNDEYDLYLLTHYDLPWVNDGMRDTPQKREWFYETIRAELERLGRPYRIVEGAGRQRLECAVAHIREFYSLDNEVLRAD